MKGKFGLYREGGKGKRRKASRQLVIACDRVAARKGRVTSIGFRERANLPGSKIVTACR